MELPAAIRCGEEVSHEDEAGGRHGGVAGEEPVEALHDVGAVQPHVREEHEHRLGVVALKLKQLLVLTNLKVLDNFHITIILHLSNLSAHCNIQSVRGARRRS